MHLCEKNIQYSWPRLKYSIKPKIPRASHRICNVYGKRILLYTNTFIVGFYQAILKLWAPGPSLSGVGIRIRQRAPPDYTWTRLSRQPDIRSHEKQLSALSAREPGPFLACHFVLWSSSVTILVNVTDICILLLLRKQALLAVRLLYTHLSARLCW